MRLTKSPRNSASDSVLSSDRQIKNGPGECLSSPLLFGSVNDNCSVNEYLSVLGVF